MRPPAVQAGQPNFRGLTEPRSIGCDMGALDCNTSESIMFARILIGARHSCRFSVKAPENLRYSKTCPAGDGEAT
jgi:hypothetical protein